MYQYFSSVPYFDSYISVFWGSLVCCFFWFSLNALLMMILDIYGHIIIICIGVPVIVGVVYNLRKLRTHKILLLHMDKVKTGKDALLQIAGLQEVMEAANVSQKEDVRLTGIVNSHVLECQDAECPCKNDTGLYDISKDQFVKCSANFHKDSTFLKYFNKKLFEDYVSKFSNSPLLHVKLAHFLFETMRNVHAALLELDLAERKKPSLKQQFAIYREKSAIEFFIRQEATQSEDAYVQLINVIEFELLLESCQKAIEVTTNYQIEFWMQVSNQLPDLNILNDLVDKNHTAAMEVDKLWGQLCAINPLYPKALQIYGNYMIEIKNHNQIGSDLLEK